MDSFLKKIVWLFLLAPSVYLIIIWNRLPARVAMHFNLNGTPDRYGSKNELIALVALLTCLAAAISFLLPLVYKIDPKKTAPANKIRLQRLSFTIAVFISFVDCIVIASAANGNTPFNIRLVFGALGLMWCIIGNYMHNIKPNYFAGFRLPWTLNNEENWRKTHLLAGKLWFAGGLIITLVCLFTSGYIPTIVFVCITMIISIVPCIYSYRIYKKEKNTVSSS